MPYPLVTPDPIEWTDVEIGEDTVLLSLELPRSRDARIDELQVMFDGCNSSSNPVRLRIDVVSDGGELIRRNEFYVPVFGGSVIYPLRDRLPAILSGHALSIKATWPGFPESSPTSTGKLTFV